MSMGHGGRTVRISPQNCHLLSVLSVRLGRIGRVIYNVNEWAKPPAKFATGGRTVRLDGYRLQPVNTVEVLGLTATKSSYS
jgi:Family of unknown function (DUF5994)